MMVAGPTGLEPAISGLTGQRVNQATPRPRLESKKQKTKRKPPTHGVTNNVIYLCLFPVVLVSNNVGDSGLEPLTPCL